MPSVLHVFDSDISPSALGQMNVIVGRREGDVLARVGRPGEGGDLPRPREIVRLFWGWKPACGPQLRELADRHGCGTIHCWSEALAGPAAGSGTPTLLSLFAPPRPRTMRRLRWAARHGATILACSQALANTLAGMGLPTEAIRVVSPAANPVDRRPEARQDARRRLGLSDDQVVLLAPRQTPLCRGMLWPIWGMAIVRQIIPNIRLILGGFGPAVQRRARFAGMAGFAEETILPPPGTDPQLFWSAADIVTLFDDSYGLPQYAQAVAAGVPVVACRAGDLGETLVDGQTALLVPPGKPRAISQALWRLCNDPALARHLVATATAQWADRISPAAVISQLDQLRQQPAAVCD